MENPRTPKDSKERINSLLELLHSDISDIEFEQIKMQLYEEIDNIASLPKGR